MNQFIKDNKSYNIVLDLFEGPLDLLLHMIREQKIDIYDIPIASVCEQYLSYLSIMESLDLEIASEWLIMAATLIEIKSKMLLPKDASESLDDEDSNSDPRVELVERLIEYEKFKSAANIFKEKEEERGKIFSRSALDINFDLKPKYELENITASDLLEALNRMLADVAEEEITSIKRRKITIRMRMREIWSRLQSASGQLVFEELFEDANDRTQIVITFLALLELLKNRKIKVRQKELFSPIEILAIEGENE
ncbi:MAG: segregation/condensation protein A [Armatimonadota bacterium]